MNKAYVGALWQRGILKKIACDENEFFVFNLFCKLKYSTSEIIATPKLHGSMLKLVLFDRYFFSFKL